MNGRKRPRWPTRSEATTSIGMFLVLGLIALEIWKPRAVSGLARAVAWPTVVFASAYLFRAPVGRLIDRVTRVDGAGIRADFENFLQGEDHADSGVTSAIASVLDSATGTDCTEMREDRPAPSCSLFGPEEVTRLVNIAARSPVLAIDAGWRVVRQALYSKACQERRVASDESGPSSAEILGWLQLEGYLNQPTAGRVRDLMALRDHAMRDPTAANSSLSEEQIFRYAVSVVGYANAILSAERGSATNTVASQGEASSSRGRR